MDQRDFLELQACWVNQVHQGFLEYQVIMGYQDSPDGMEMKVLLGRLVFLVLQV